MAEKETSVWDKATDYAASGLRAVYKKARKAIFEADDPRKFGVFDMVDNLEDREKRIKKQVE